MDYLKPEHAQEEAVVGMDATSEHNTIEKPEGFVAKVDTQHRGNLKTAKDGHTVLIPQPSDDPRDPLNWSPFKKHVILLIISFAAFLPDYGSAVGAVTLIPQAA
jgi:hypothetical protein